MIGILRKYQQPLLILVTIMVIIAFLWLYNDTKLDKVGSGRVATIYGTYLAQTDVDRGGRMFQLCSALGMFEMIQGLAGQAPTRDRAIEGFIFNRLVLAREAENLQIYPTDSEVVAMIRSLPAFQTGGQFDVAKYSKFLEEMLAPNGFTQAQLEEAARMNLQFDKVRGLVGTGSALSDAEARSAFEQTRRRMSISTIAFKTADDAAQIQPTTEDLQLQFEQNPARYASEEKRKVQYVRFTLSPEEAKLEGRERVRVMQALSDKAGDFTQKMLAPNAEFAATAASAGIEVKTTGEFSKAAGDPAFADVPAATAAAFNLTREDPNGDAVAYREGFVVLHLDAITESRPLTLEEAKDRVTADFKESRAREQITARAAKLQTALQAGVASGKTFADAAKELGVVARQLPAFSLSEPSQEIPHWREIAVRSLEMKPGQVSGFTAIPDGGLLVFLEKYEPVPTEEFEKERTDVVQGLTQRKNELLFQEWLRKKREAADVKFL